MAIGPVAFKSAHVLICLAIAGRAAVAGGSEVFRGCSAPVTDLSKPQTAVFLVSWLQYHQHKEVFFLPLDWSMRHRESTRKPVSCFSFEHAV